MSGYMYIYIVCIFSKHSLSILSANGFGFACVRAFSHSTFFLLNRMIWSFSFSLIGLTLIYSLEVEGSLFSCTSNLTAQFLTNSSLATCADGKS